MNIEIVKNSREAILTGEIGALLHDIGKCHPDFLRKNSVEGGINFYHTNIDGFLNINFVHLIKNKKFEFKINGNETNIYLPITKHHNNTNDKVVKLIQSCDRLDSADDKGIVRKKQSIDNIIISSPFGYEKEKLDLQCLQKRLDDLEDNLIGLFKSHISGGISLTCFRESLMNKLKVTFSHALGETRVPANDVTLWDHSHSTASLFKTVLCSLALGENPNPKKLQWEILGFCWDGIGFTNKGKKIADIIVRNQIIEEIKEELKNKFEDEIPVGNAIYEDTNGVYFTFPSLSDDNKSKELAEECAKIGLEIIRNKSDNEIWSFFTLSKASRSLTTIADELKFASGKRNIPKMSPTLFVRKEKGENREERIISNNPQMSLVQEDENKKYDICPVCRIRTKPVDLERCKVCEKRRNGRLTDWLSNRENTIWIDEVADKNSRVALLTLNFNLDKWLDGTMIGTIYSQTFEDWYESRAKKIKENVQFMNKIKKSLNRDLSSDSFKELADYFIEYFIKEWKKDEEFADNQDKISLRAKVLNTFFEGFVVNEKDKDKKNGNDNPFYVKYVWKSFKEKLDKTNTKNAISTLFTQNPSPARLYRIWKETEEFFALVIEEIKDSIYSNKWKRIKFNIDISNLELKYGSKMEESKPYIIKIDGLDPENLLVFHNKNGEFYTIESLEKFKFSGNFGAEAIKDRLKYKGFHYLAKEDNPDENLLQNNQYVKITNPKTEEYYPLVEITKSPLLLRLIVPAQDSVKISNMINKLYNERFEKVIGKLPLSIGLVVSKRKFPLYVLLDAGDRLLNDKGFRKSVEMDSWWNLDGLRNDGYYGFYPNKKLDKKYTLDDLSLLSKGKPYFLYPGYFDFDLLLATTDRYKISYKRKERADEDYRLKRADKDYRLFTARPYYFYQISQMMDLWEILSNNISPSQMNFIEEMFTDKLREWKSIEDIDKQYVFRKFAEATLKDAFANNWEKLRKETQDFLINATLSGLLLDTIIFFRHVIKTKGSDENE